MSALFVIAYAIVALLAARHINYRLRLEPCDAVGDAAFAMLLGCLWPLALPLAVVMWRPRQTPAELAEQVRQRDERIAELERDLRIGS